MTSAVDIKKIHCLEPCGSRPMKPSRSNNKHASIQWTDRITYLAVFYTSRNPKNSCNFPTSPSHFCACIPQSLLFSISSNSPFVNAILTT